MGVGGNCVKSLGAVGVQDDREQLKQSVEKTHGCSARWLRAEPVNEQFQNKAVWQGVVHLFEISGHASATRAYAWSSPIEGSTKRRFFAVLEVPPVTNPVEAVRAAIVQEHRSLGGEK